MPLTGTISMGCNIIQTPAAGVSEIISAPATVARSYQWNFASGTGLNQADLMFADQRTLTTGQNESLDLAGTLAPLFGATTLTLARLKGFMIFSLAANTTNLTVSVPASGVALLTGTTPALALIKPGCGFLWWDSSAAAVTVTATSADLINIANSSGASATYDIVIVGASA